MNPFAGFEPHTVYLAACAELGMLKIGKSVTGARTRLRALNKGTHVHEPCRGKWLLLDSIAVYSSVESKLHRILAPFRHPAAPTTAREWYRDCEQVRGAFAALKEGLAA